MAQRISVVATGYLLVSFFLSHLNSLGVFLSVKAAREEKVRKKWGERRYLFNCNFISLDIFVQLLCSKESFPWLFENCFFSQLRRWNILVDSVVNKSKFSVVMSSCVFVLLVSAYRLASNRYNPHAKSKGLGKIGMLPC